MESSLVLSELLPPERVRVPLGSHAKAELLRELVRLALPDADEATCDGVVAVVEAREADVSTAMDFVGVIRQADGERTVLVS